MTKSKLIEHLRNLSNDTLHVKVFLNQSKVGDYLMRNLTLRKVMPELEKLKLYTLNLYYKDNGEYYLSDLRDVFIVLDAEDKLAMFEPVKYENSKIYLKYIRDCSLLGHSTKKIMIERTNYKLYDIHVCSVHSESSVAQPRVYDFNTSVIIATDEEFSIHQEVSRKLSRYIFDIHKIVCSEGCSKNENGWITESDLTNKIYVEVKLERKKRWRERFHDFFKNLLSK